MTPRTSLVVTALLTFASPLLTGCVKTTSRTAFVRTPPDKDPAPATVRTAPSPDVGARIAKVADYTLGHYPPGFRDDCSGFVEATLSRVGIPLRGSTKMMWVQMTSRGWTHRRRLPRVGDLAFFDDTYDRNGNGLRDDDLSHVAIVLSVDSDGTIRLAHAGTSAGRSRFSMNLLHPHDSRDEDGERLNDALRRAGRRSARGTLAAELLRGFATIRAR